MENNEQYYIIRTDRAGVFFAQIAERRGDEADLRNARRIHYWSGATECLGIATNGVGHGSRITVSVTEMTVLGVIEIHPATEKATECLKNFASWIA